MVALDCDRLLEEEEGSEMRTVCLMVLRGVGKPLRSRALLLAESNRALPLFRRSKVHLLAIHLPVAQLLQCSNSRLADSARHSEVAAQVLEWKRREMDGLIR